MLTQEKLKKIAPEIRRMQNRFEHENNKVAEMMKELERLNSDITLAQAEQVKVNSERNELSATIQGLQRKIVEQREESNNRVQSDNEYLAALECKCEEQLHQYYQVQLMVKEIAFLVSTTTKSSSA